MKEWLEKVSVFCRDVVKLKTPDIPSILSPDRLEFYLGAAEEELQEFQEATQAGDLGEAADALVDLIYFTLGRLYEMGIPADVVFDDVHDANMRKRRGIKKGRRVKHRDDAMKPENWVAPDHSWLAHLPKETISLAKALAFLERENLKTTERSTSNAI